MHDYFVDRSALVLDHTARHEASDPDGIAFNHRHRPNHRSAGPVRFGDQGFVGNIDPFILKADSIVAILRIPVGICDREAVRERTAQPSA